MLQSLLGVRSRQQPRLIYSRPLYCRHRSVVTMHCLSFVLHMNAQLLIHLHLHSPPPLFYPFLVVTPHTLTPSPPPFPPSPDVLPQQQWCDKCRATRWISSIKPCNWRHQSSCLFIPSLVRRVSLSLPRPAPLPIPHWLLYHAEWVSRLLLPSSCFFMRLLCRGPGSTGGVTDSILISSAVHLKTWFNEPLAISPISP